MKWTKTADVSAYEIYLKIIKKTTFGAFTIDSSGGTVAGGYVSKYGKKVDTVMDKIKVLATAANDGNT